MEFVYGALVGVAQTLIGFPFDTLKTRRQAFPHAPLAFHSLYKGVGFPLTSTVLITSNNFGMASYVNSQGYSWWVGGGVAGFLSSFLISPLEIRKVNRQVSLKGKVPLHAPLSRGLSVTIARECPAHAFYFGVYHWAKDYGFHPFLSGALAGLSSWTTTYPIDAIKSRMLADPTLSLSQAIEMGNFWRGYSFAATRALLVNSLAFWLYENLHTIK